MTRLLQENELEPGTQRLWDQYFTTESQSVSLQKKDESVTFRKLCETIAARISNLVNISEPYLIPYSGVNIFPRFWKLFPYTLKLFPCTKSKIFIYKLLLHKPILWCSYYASMLTKHFFDFFPACSLLLQPAQKDNFPLFSNLLA